MTSPTPTSAVYGAPPLDLAERNRAAVQVSPLVVGSAALEDLAPGSLDDVTMLAPPGTLERRYALALALRALTPGGALTAMALKDRGGSRLKAELSAFGCEVYERAKRHHRICAVERSAEPVGLDEAIAQGSPQRVAALDGLWSQPGVFSWDRIDPGTALLLKHLPMLSGAGADLGCGVGVLARAVLASPGVTRLALIDSDRRAVEAARRNITDPRAQIAWADATGEACPDDLNFVVMNPPFHDGGAEDKALGQRFIARAHQALKKGGTLWLVANMHLPYEPILTPLFAKVERRADNGGYKVFEARK